MRKPSEQLLMPGERLDDLQRDGLCIIQDPSAFCFGMDAVLLSGFVPAQAKGRLIDLGTGGGIIPILLSAKTHCAPMTGLEIDPASAGRARRSIRYNGLSDRIGIIEGDIREAGRLFAPASFDIVTANPPYMKMEHGLTGAEDPRTAARHEKCCTLEDVTAAARYLLRSSGHFYMVHRPFRLTEIFCTLHDAGLEPKRMRMVHPYADREPNMVLLDCVKGGKSRLRTEPPLIVFEREGEYTRELKEIYGKYNPGSSGTCAPASGDE